MTKLDVGKIMKNPKAIVSMVLVTGVSIVILNSLGKRFPQVDKILKGF